MGWSSVVFRLLGSHVVWLTIGVTIGSTPRAHAQSSVIKPTLGRFSSDWVEIVSLEATAVPSEGGMLCLSLRNKSEQSLWTTIVVKTPNPTQDREVTEKLEAGGTETYACAQRALVPKKDYRLLVQVYESEGRTTLPAPPQATFRFQKGDRIRAYTLTTTGRFVGNIVAFDDTTITLSAVKGGSPTMLRRQDITKLSISVGRRGSRGKHALVGAAIGAGVGAVIGLASGDDDPDDCEEFCLFTLTAEEKVFINAVLLAPVGALIGVVVPTERWDDVPLDRVRVSVEPGLGRAGLSLTYRF